MKFNNWLTAIKSNTMRRTNEQTIGEAIKELIKTFKLDEGLNEAKLIDSWAGVVGEMINNHTQKLWINKRILYVVVDSAALRNELNYAREKIVKSLNREVGEDVIDRVVFK